VGEISSRLIVNQASLKLKRNLLQPIMDDFARAVESKKNAGK
jgi:ATP phosphoribosyltransferase